MFGNLESCSSIMAERIGQQVGNYRLLRLLGHGGFADVYLGEHIYLKTEAAIKVLHTQLAPEDIEKFRTEALTIAHLMHPHIIRVLDFDVENAIPFLVMDYAPNGTLRDRHSKGVRLQPATFMPYVRQVASALQYAHDQKFIHRDVKPENMLLGRTDEVLLSDFGIALVAQNTMTQSTEDTVIGTMAYMAPEQIQGKPRPASDQYALAVVVYEWISGQKPFNGSYMEIVTQHLSADPPPLNEAVLAIPHAVQQVLQKALAKDPHSRFARVQDFADALEQAYRSRVTTVAEQSSNMAVPPYQMNEARQQYMPPPAYRPNQMGNVGMGRQSPLAYQAVPPTVNVPSNAAGKSSAQISHSAKKVKRGLKRGLRAVLIILVLISLAVCGLIFGIYHYFAGNNTPAPATNTNTSMNTTGATALATDFMQAVASRNYDQAYNDLGPQVSEKAQFKQSAQSEDQCEGTVKTYQSVNISQNGNTLIDTYKVTRVKLKQPYDLRLTLQGDGSGRWQITDYSSDAPLC